MSFCQSKALQSSRHSVVTYGKDEKNGKLPLVLKNELINYNDLKEK